MLRSKRTGVLVANFNFDSNEYADSPEVVLASFVWTVYEDVDVFVDQREPLFSPTRGDEDERQQMREILDTLVLAWPDVFSGRQETVRAVLRQSSSTLSPLGLAGNALRLKMLAWERARDRFERVMVGRYQSDQRASDGPFTEFQSIRPAQRLSLRPRIFRRLSAQARVRLKRLNALLGYADIPLGSLLALIPLAEPLVEVKQVIEQIAGDLDSET
jgi:hypothetical protein